MVSGIFVDFQIFLFLTRIIPEDVFQNQGKLLYPPPVIVPPLHRRGNYYTPAPVEGGILFYLCPSCTCAPPKGVYCFTSVLLIPHSTGGGMLFYLCPSYTPAPPEGGILFYLCPSIRPKIFFGAFFSAAIDGRNLIFGHKLHIGTPYRGKRFLTCQIPTSCLPT